MATGFKKKPVLMTRKNEERGDYIKDVIALDQAIEDYSDNPQAVHVLEILLFSAEKALEKMES